MECAPVVQMILGGHKWLFKQVSLSWLVPKKWNDNPRATCREVDISLPASQKCFHKTVQSFLLVFVEELLCSILLV